MKQLNIWMIIAWFALIAVTILSLIPLPELPKVPGTDKTHHFIAYGSIAFFMAIRPTKRLSIYLIAVIIWSGLIELIQPFVNRYGEWMDLLANSIGLVIGYLTAIIFRRYFLKE